MRYKSFRIRNFKGIKDTTVSLESIAGASVFAFVGLNESGKTTVLEAIHSFSPDPATSRVIGGDEESGVPYADRVPRHLISSFTDDISVSATIQIEEIDKSVIIASILDEHELIIENIPDEVRIERHQRFEDGDFIKAHLSLRTELRVKNKSERRFRAPTTEEKGKLKHAIYGFTPDISYFPTFVFDFPEKIYLTKRGDHIQDFYRSVFQDILDLDGREYKIDKDIVRRVRADDLVIPWQSFIPAWASSSSDSKIRHVMDRASNTVTRVVFGRWNEIFGEDARGKQIVIDHFVDEGQSKVSQGQITKTNAHDIYVKFQIKDSARRFNVNDRSLGFRWFFSFMLFTQFRAARKHSRPVLFLFDEPASNLHAAAQQKLIDCFPEIARDGHALVYTTHSHYMIEPKWLEQTFIVTNRADDPPPSVVDAVSLDDESLDVTVSSYRSFVNAHPNQTSYFQPILDRLDVVPSRFDVLKAAVVVEGKSDYYVLRYAAKLLGRPELPLIPGLGAGTLNALAAMHVGWNLKFLFVLDGDRQGESERSRYIKEYGIPKNQTATLTELLSCLTVIEDLLDERACQLITAALGLVGTLKKPEIRRFFQERLASDNITHLGAGFNAKAGALLNELTKRTSQASG